MIQPSVRLDPELLPFSTARRFVLSGYVFSHGQLLLRSDRDYTDETTRLEVLFTDARFVALPGVMHELVISIGGPALVEPYVDDLAPFELDYGVKVYALRGKDWRGFVVGGAVWMAEDEAAPNTPSALGGLIYPRSSPFGVLD